MELTKEAHDRFVLLVLRYMKKHGDSIDDEQVDDFMQEFCLSSSPSPLAPSPEEVAFLHSTLTKYGLRSIDPTPPVEATPASPPRVDETSSLPSPVNDEATP